MYILRGAPASRNRATARMASALIIGWAFEVTALEEKLSVDACESPWQHERFEAALNPGRTTVHDHLKPHTSLGQSRCTFGDIRIITRGALKLMW